MKVTIPQPTLAAAIDRGGSTAPTKSPVKILECVRIIVGDGSLALASSDQDRFSEAVVTAEASVPGSLCVNAAAIRTLIGKHPKSGIVTMEAEEGYLIVTCGRSKVRMPALPVDRFPAWADETPDATWTMPAVDFERGMNRVRFAAAPNTDVTRVWAQGVLLDVHEGKLHLVATDGYRLAVSGMSAPAGSENCPKVTVPNEAISTALTVFKDAGTIDVSVSKKAIGIAADGLRLSARLIDAEAYPAYERGIPARGGFALSFKRADFRDCLGRAECLVGEGAFSAITAVPDGETLRLEARNHNGGEATEEMSATIAAGYQPFGFNPRYGASFLAALNVDEITIEQTTPKAPLLIYSEDAPDFVGMLAPVGVS